MVDERIEQAQALADERLERDLHDWSLDAEITIRQLAAMLRKLVAEREADRAAMREALEAAQHARQFIVNGVEFGYIRMPDADTPDTAHDTLPEIESAITDLRQRLGETT